MNTDKSKKSPAEEREERILAYWNKHKIFEKSVNREAPHGNFVFYDGPPFATGMPHFGHILPTSIKDAVPRYKTMRGYRVRRRWGWDCHGLPVENLIEKELDLKTKKDIINYGIKNFNQAAREAVHRYVNNWKEIIPRLGRWADMDNDYETMNATYTESVWWAFKELYKKALVYEGFKPMQICPHCETTLSNFEVAQGYKDIKDVSVYAKFELVDEPGTFLLAWTTTPWTLPGNVALAVGKDIEYVKVKVESEEPGGREKIGQTPPLREGNLSRRVSEEGGEKVYRSEKAAVDFYVLAKERLSATFKKEKYEIVAEMKGSDLVGKSYKPLFDYYSNDKSLKNLQNGWKIYAADFVTTTDGTGIVHVAPAFGADDYTLGQKENLPFVQHVNIDGTFKAEVKDFAGLKVKPKDTDEDTDAHIRTDIKVIQWLQNKGLFFAKENLTHSYPHCWRCGTPLLNYAASSWFVRVSDLTHKLVKENKKVKWVPPEVGEGRFGNWLLGAKDWAISRSRFWGAPIPVWRAEKSGQVHVIGSIADLKKYSKAKNTYYVMRHGEAENNTLMVMSTKADDPKHLTKKGKEQVKKAAEFFVDKNVDLVFASPFIRTRETADILADALSFNKKDIFIDERLHELDAGVYDGKPFKEFLAAFPFENRFSMRLPEAENYTDIRKRVGGFIYDMERRYSGKNILIVTHDSPGLMLEAISIGLDDRSVLDLQTFDNPHHLRNADPKKLDFSPLPHNDDYEIDLHRPFIDDIELKLPNGERLIRVEEVFDCWFESGSMPFGEAHYPFEVDAASRSEPFLPSLRGKKASRREKAEPSFNPETSLLSKITGGIMGKSRGYPADFIAEGLDQTRGWFYSMLVLGTALFERAPYKNVIVNGIVLSEDGQKMSKSKSNFPDLLPVVNKYGADALRYYLLSSPLVRAQEFCFSEKGTDEVAKKHIGRLLNVMSFYELYAKLPGPLVLRSVSSHNILDQWITSRLNELNGEVTRAMEKYELDKATRPFADFIDDLSTWYLRRSRDRFKSDDEGDKSEAIETTRFVLLELSKLLAPFMPFVADDIYLRLKGGLESVHLEVWPVAQKIDTILLANMKVARDTASLGLEARSKAKINVRQPLQSLKVKSQKSKTAPDGRQVKDAAMLDLIKEEVNVKEVVFDTNLATEVVLDTDITPELKEEGELRDLVRAIQDMRKENGLTIHDRPMMRVFDQDKTRQEFIEKNKNFLVKAVLLKDVEIGGKAEMGDKDGGKNPGFELVL